MYTATHNRYKLGGFVGIVTWLPGGPASGQVNTWSRVNQEIPVLLLNGLVDLLVPVVPAGSKTSAALDSFFSDFSYLNIVVSAGDCTATSCPEVIEAPCTKGVSGEDITLDATLCVVPGGPDACPAGSCKAPLLGECGTHDVYDADWTVSVGSLTVALTVPSTVPAGSTCAEPTD